MPSFGLVNNNPLLNNRSSNIITYGFINVRCNENYIITCCNFFLIPQENVVDNHVVMLHVKDELE